MKDEILKAEDGKLHLIIFKIKNIFIIRMEKIQKICLILTV
jgi:hypothetical protein